MTTLDEAREIADQLDTPTSGISFIPTAGAAQTIRDLIAMVETASRVGAEEMRERTAQVARHACLVPPDGGSPTEEERQLPVE